MIVRCIGCGVPVKDGMSKPNNECYCPGCKTGDLKVRQTVRQPSRTPEPPKPSRKGRG